MAKKISKGVKRVMSIIFHLAVLVMMVNLYDAGRALLVEKGILQSAPKIPTKDKKDKTQPAGNQKDTLEKVAERGTSMEDLIAEKKRKEKEKAQKEE